MNTPNQETKIWKMVSIALAGILLSAFNIEAAEGAANNAGNQVAGDKDEATTVTQQEKAQCKENLLKISAAIQAYRKDHNELPNWLSDLFPAYLAATNLIICPVSARTGTKGGGMPDPKVLNAYHYEFNPDPIGKNVQSFWGETPITMREWKQQQERILGGDVPIVRCFTHGRNSLDLTLSGKIREDPLVWEQQFTNDKITLSDLAPRPITKPGPAQER